MDLGAILKTGELPPELTSKPVLPNIPAVSQEDTAGVKRIGNLLIAGILKGLEIVLPIFGVESEEGKRIKRAISNLTPLTKGITTEDLLSFLKLLGDLLQTRGTGLAGLSGLGAETGLGAGTPTIPGAPTPGAPLLGVSATPSTESERPEINLEELLKRGQETTK